MGVQKASKAPFRPELCRDGSAAGVLKEGEAGEAHEVRGRWMIISRVYVLRVVGYCSGNRESGIRVFECDSG